MECVQLSVSFTDHSYLSCLAQLAGQQVLAMVEALGDEELKRRNMKGLMAELDTMDTPIIAWGGERYFKGEDCVFHLYSSTPGHGAPGVSQDLLPDELIHHVGQVGDDEDGHHGQGEVGDFPLGS